MAVTSFTALTAAVVASVAAASPIKARDPMDDFQNVMINGHNWYRGEHAATALTWDDDAASNAAAWVNNCVFEHQVSYLCLLLFRSLYPPRMRLSNEYIYIV